MSTSTNSDSPPPDCGSFAHSSSISSRTCLIWSLQLHKANGQKQVEQAATASRLVVDILNLDELNVHSEEQFYRDAMCWVHHNLSHRRSHSAYPMQHIRLPPISPKFLVGTVGADLLIRSDERCRDLVEEANIYLSVPQERPLMQGRRRKPCEPAQSCDWLFTVGGWFSGNAVASAEQ
ncbi:Kelch protein 20 [Fasciolopsis buskii]|uniref:Kelch protein 20 n=1 Tax=Fasciolopsis buskii TaxID=27845 RepID=A0A8E0S7R6_9TREM|nr:Kelch protein 20 [Fasciolopsis buski]